jgi:FtsH-binding integral membrane protein
MGANMADFNNNYQSQYRNMTIHDSRAVTISFINRVYAWMCGGLLLTALGAYAVIASPELQKVVLKTPGVFLILILLTFGLVVGLSWGINKMNSTVAAVAFVVYSLLNGLTLSVLFYAYTKESLSLAFLVTAGTFGVMSLYGFITGKDLTAMGNLCLMGLFGIIIASVVNIFLRSSGMMWIISYLGVLIFMGLTAYDTQKIKEMSVAMDSGGNSEHAKKYAILGALTLYLDFINLFILFLRIFGGRRN